MKQKDEEEQRRRGRVRDQNNVQASLRTLERARRSKRSETIRATPVYASAAILDSANRASRADTRSARFSLVTRRRYLRRPPPDKLRFSGIYSEKTKFSIYIYIYKPLRCTLWEKLRADRGRGGGGGWEQISLARDSLESAINFKPEINAKRLCVLFPLEPCVCAILQSWIIYNGSIIYLTKYTGEYNETGHDCNCFREVRYIFPITGDCVLLAYILLYIYLSIYADFKTNKRARAIDQRSLA